MNTSLIFNRFTQRDHIWFHIILLLWLLGLLVGILLGAVIAKNAPDVERSSLFVNPGFVWSVLVTISPVILTGLLLRCQRVSFVMPLILIESVTRGFSGIFLFVLIGNGTWLVRGLYLISNSCASVLMWWIIIRYRRYNGVTLKRDTQTALAFAVLFAVIDALLVSPFLHRLSFYF